MIALLFIFVPLVVILAMFEFASFAVYGRPISEATLDTFFEKHFTSLELNGHDTTILSRYDMGYGFPFVAKHRSVYSNWYVYGFGTIPSWSKWSKLLDEKCRQLQKPAVKLTDI